MEEVEKYRVNKGKCIGCGACIARCPGATRIGKDGKAEIVDQRKLEACGGENVCPFGAIERVQKKEESLQSQSSLNPYVSFPPFYGPPFGGRGLGRGRGHGRLKGMGKSRGRRA